MENLSNIAAQLGKRGGKKSAESRFAGRSMEEVSAIMRSLRLTPKQDKEVTASIEAMAENMRKNIK